MYYQPERVQLHDLTFVPMLSAEAVEARTEAIGAALTVSYHDKNPLFISVLNGAFVFAADVVRSFEGNCGISFVKLASYAGTQSTGNVQTVVGLQDELRDRHLIVVEDILDSGRTLHFFLDFLQQQQPASICTVILLRKPDAAEFEVQADYVGFDIENRFVVGYGLDYDGLGRNLNGIYQLAAE